MTTIKKITIEFNQTEFEVEYIVDKELYSNGISLESAKLNDVDFLQDFNDNAINEIELLVLRRIKLWA